MGNTVLKAAYGARGDSKAAATKDGGKMYALGAQHNLSKRSYLYGYYTATKNDAGGTYGIGQGQGSAIVPDAGRDPSVFSIGMRHTF